MIKIRRNKSGRPRKGEPPGHRACECAQFSDWTCPACERAAKRLERQRQRNDGDGRVPDLVELFNRGENQ